DIEALIGLVSENDIYVGTVKDVWGHAGCYPSRFSRTEIDPKTGARIEAFELSRPRGQLRVDRLYICCWRRCARTQMGVDTTGVIRLVVLDCSDLRPVGYGRRR